MVDVVVFAISALIIISGAVGVIAFPNPVHAALSLIATFFGVAVLFVQQEAHFLALVQVVVYAGAIVVLFLFVIMLLGVDRAQELGVEPLAGQRAAGVAVGAVLLALVVGGLFLSGDPDRGGNIALTGSSGQVVPTVEGEQDVVQLARDLFTRHLLTFEATGILLTVATVGAVVLVRARGAEDLIFDEPGTAQH